jgi:hypothetical protein
MSRVKAGDVLSCEVCGLAVIVDDECGCVMAEIICCEEPMMNKGPSKKKKAPVAVKPKGKTSEEKAKKKADKKPADKKKKPAKK